MLSNSSFQATTLPTDIRITFQSTHLGTVTVSSGVHGDLVPRRDVMYA